MATDPGFKFYPGDYLRDTQNLSEKSQVAYDRIMCEHMRNTSLHMNKIAVSKKQVNFFTKRLSPDEKEELLYVLTEVEGGYQIEWVAVSISKTKSYSLSRSKNRSLKSKKDMKTYDEHMDNDNDNDNDIDIDKKKRGMGEKGKINWDMVLNTQKIESLSRNNKISVNQVRTYFDQFKIDMEDRDDLYRDPIEYRSHFASWMKVKIEKKGTDSGIMRPIGILTD